MLDLKLPWKKVKVGGPIDFAQWQLSEQVRGMHMAVDKEGDIIAIPVVPVDVTGPKVAPTPNWTYQMFQQQGIIAPSTTAWACQQAFPSNCDWEIDWINVMVANVAAADTAYLHFQPPLLLFATEMILRPPGVLAPIIGVNGFFSFVPNPVFRFSTPYPRQAIISVGTTTDATAGNRTFTMTISGRRRIRE